MDIKSVIKTHDYTLLEVANKMGITKGAISQIVNGSPNVKTLRTIADIIGCKVGDFFADEMSVTEQTECIVKCPHCNEMIHLKVTPI